MKNFKKILCVVLTLLLVIPGGLAEDMAQALTNSTEEIGTSFEDDVSSDDASYDAVGNDGGVETDGDVGNDAAAADEDAEISASSIDPDVAEVGEIDLSEVLDDEDVEVESFQADSDAPVPSTVTYCFIALDTLISSQTAVDGEEIIAPDDPAAPEGMVFTGWELEDGTAVFTNNTPVIAHTDPIVSEINVIAKFVEGTDSTSSDKDMGLEDETAATDDDSSSNEIEAAEGDAGSAPTVADETAPSVDNDADMDGSVDTDENAEEDVNADEEDADAVKDADKDESANDAEAVNSSDDDKDADNHTDNEEENQKAVEGEEKGDGEAEPSDDKEEDESSEDESAEDEDNGEDSNEDSEGDQENTINPIRVVFNVTPEDAVITVKAVKSEAVACSDDEAADAQPAENQPADELADAQPTDEAIDTHYSDNTSESTTASITAQDDGSFALLPGEYVYTATAEGYVPIEGVPFFVSDEPLTISVVLEAIEIEPVPFDQSRTVNGVVVTVKAEPGVFPANAELSVKRVPVYKQRQANAAIEDVREEDQNVAVSYTFDIKVIDPETREEHQPAEGQTVSVSFALAEVADENLTTNVYHIDDSGEAEKLDVTQEDEVTATVETDGFSLYTVELTYNSLQYVLPGDMSVSMSEILAALELTGEVTAVEVSDSDLFSASNATGAWVVTAHRAFDTDEWMKVTINEIEYTIAVTDDQDTRLYQIDIDGNPDGTVEANAQVAAAGEIVTLTVTPNKGYKLISLNVHKANDLKTTVPVENNTFTMPAFHVLVLMDFGPDLTTWAGLQAAFSTASFSEDSPTIITLEEDVTADSTDAALEISSRKYLVLDLNGYKIDRNLTEATKNGYVIKVGMEGNLTVRDSSQGQNGAITGGKSTFGGGVYIGDLGIFNLTGGNVSGNTAELGGGVYIEGMGTFNMTGGSIRNNNAEVGGGVFLNGGTFNLTAGSVSGNNAEQGGGVNIWDGTVNLSGSPVITENMAKGKVDNVYLNTDKKIIVTGKLTNTMPIGVTMQSPGAFTSDYSSGGEGDSLYTNPASPATFFTSDNAEYAVGLVNGEVVLGTAYHVTLPEELTGGSVTAVRTSYIAGDTVVLTVTPENSYALASLTVVQGGTEIAVTNNTFVMPAGDVIVSATFAQTWASLQTAFNTASTDKDHPSTITLAQDVKDTRDDDYLTVPKGKYVTIDLNGHNIDRWRFNPEDWYDGMEVDDRDSGAVDDGFVLLVQGSLTVEDNSANHGGAITGGSNKRDIRDDTGDGYNHGGGGVCVDGGCFTLNSGSVRHNSARYGGGVFVINGTFNLSGGSVSGNTAGQGGGVYANGGTFNMTDGSVSGNRAGEEGGGVYMHEGTFTLSGGSVSGNGAKDGGGVNVNDGSFTVSGGEISGNNVWDAYASHGGGVYVGGGSFRVSGAPVITGNFKDGAPDNVYLDSLKVIAVTGALTDGASLYLNAAKDATVAVGGKTTGSETAYSITSTDAAKFHGDNSTLNPVLDGGEVKLVTEWGALQVQLNAGGTVTLTKDVTAIDGIDNTALTIASGKSVTLDLNGHTIDTNEEIRALAVEGTLTLTDSSSNGNGKITSGGGVDVFSGTFNMSGGTISDTTAIWGGGVYVYNGTFNMSGGTITRCTAGYGGGGVCVYNSTFNMSGGTITHCTTIRDGGGGVDVYSSTDGSIKSTFTMIGGNITDNTAIGNGGGVYVENNCTFTMSGGSITGNTATNNGGGVDVEDGGTLNVSGAPAISGNTKGTGDSAAANNVVFTAADNNIKVTGALTDGASLYVNAARAATVSVGGSYALTDADAAKFHSDGGSYTGQRIGSTSSRIVFDTPWASLQTWLNEGGSVKLTRDYEAGDDETALEVPDGKTVTLDLNGHIVNRNLIEAAEDGYVIRVEGNLTLKDSNPSATHNPIVTYTDPMDNSPVTVNGGVITGGNYIDSGGGLQIQGGTVTLEGGSIVGNRANYGGGVYVGGGLMMSGGSIIGNTASDSGGGVHNDGFFKMSGGSITGNQGGGVSHDSAKSFELSGNPSISGNTLYDERTPCNVYLIDTQTIYINGNLETTARIGVTMKAHGVFTDSLSGKGTAANFISDSDDYCVRMNANGEGELRACKAISIPETANGTVTASVDGQSVTQAVAGETVTLTATPAKGYKLTSLTYTVDGGDPTAITDNQFTMPACPVTVSATFGFDLTQWAGLQLAFDAASEDAEYPTTITLTADVTAASTDAGLIIPEDKYIILDLNGHTLYRNLTEEKDDGYVIKVKSNLTVKDSVPDAEHSPAITYTDPCTETEVTVTGGVITGGNNSGNGGGVYVGGGTFKLSGGSVCGNNADSGGGVYVGGGTFNLRGGSVCGNNANSGGGVYMRLDSTFELSGGSVCGNKASIGGGVHVCEGRFTMSGGNVSGNFAGTGGVSVEESMATFNMTDGNVSGNRAYQNGGGVVLKSGGSFTISKGSVSGNTAGYGGGVYVDNGSLKLSGSPAITGNTANSNANNVYLKTGQTITVTGALTNEMPIGVTMENPGVFAEGGGNYTLTQTDLARFASDSDDYCVRMNAEDKGELLACYAIRILDADHGTVTTSVGVQPTAGALKGETVTLTVMPDISYVLTSLTVIQGDTPVDLDENNQFTMPAGDVTISATFAQTWASLQAAFSNANTDADNSTLITLTQDMTVSGTDGALIVSSGKYVTLDLNDHYILYTGDATETPIIDVETGGNLTLRDSAADKTTRYVELDNGRGTSVVTAKPDGEEYKDYITVTGGCITGGYYTHPDPASVRISGKLIMNGGTICGNYSSYRSGVKCYDDSCEFTMSGGAIIGNTSGSDGGGVYVRGTFTMSGGTISHNTASNGGGVYVNGSSTTFTMTGGAISHNTASSEGGGVSVSEGTFTMTGGTITGNTSNSNGGGVYVNSSGTFDMSNGEITGNTSGTTGGGVFVYVYESAGTFKLSGAPKVSGNTANGVGSNVALYSDENDVSVITVTGEMSNTAPIGVLTVKWDDGANAYVPDPRVFTAGGDNYTLKDSDLARFTSDSANQCVRKNANGKGELLACYAINIQNADHGAVKAFVGAQPTVGALEGETVTLTVTADKGYELSRLTYQVGGGNPMTIKGSQFTMPAGNVTVSATFVKTQTKPQLDPASGNVNTTIIEEPTTDPPTTDPPVAPVTIPKVPVSVKAKAAKKGKVTVSWKKIKKTKKTKALLAQIKGVEVQISTDPNFASDVQTRNLGKKKTKVTIKGLQKKTVYYVRVRYTDGAGGVSEWSAVKRVKTKKK